MIISGISFILAGSLALASQAQPVPVPEDPSTMPQLEIDGVGAGTLKIARSPKAAVDFSDSALIIGGAQRLYGGGIGSFGLGIQTFDETIHGTGNALFVHQAFFDYQGEHLEFILGRTDSPTAHPVDLPTLRGDDLTAVNGPLNPFSNGTNLEEHRYSNVASVTINQGLTWFESLHAQHLINSANLGTDTGINAYGARFEYLSPPGMEALASLVSADLGYEHYLLTSNAPHGLNATYLGGAFNLIPSMTNRLELRLQDAFNWGSELSTLNNLTDTYQASSHTTTASIRYLHSPFGHPGHQLALTVGHKNYFKAANASQWGAALTGVKRLGQGFDLVAQYQAERRSSGLLNAEPRMSFVQVFELGFVFNFNATFNQHLSPRRTLLNQQHQYIPD